MGTIGNIYVPGDDDSQSKTVARIVWDAIMEESQEGHCDIRDFVTEHQDHFTGDGMTAQVVLGSISDQ